ncbi:MAG: flagellar motor switch protein FliG [Alphaproteobacteria bacterium]|nr:flagellar motor switch protein FliG [Alphaproteobacteria bacterium]
MAEPTSGSTNLSPAEKAAVLMMALGEADAAEVIKFLSPREVNRLSGAIARLNKVPKATVENVMVEFVSRIRDETAIGLGVTEYLRNALGKALGEERASALLERIMNGGDSAGIEAVKWEDPRVVAEMIREEHPQIIAMILAYVEPEQAQDVMQVLPDGVIEQVIPRLATLEVIPPSAVRELNEALEDQLAGESQQVRLSNVGGIKAAAEILNRFEASRAQSVLDRIKSMDPELSQRIYDNMFVFHDLLEVDDRSIRTLLQEINQALLVPALKGVDAAVREKVTRNMSQRAAESLNEEIEAKGPVRVAEVEAAQKEIITIAKRLEAEGRIILRTDAKDLVA